MKYKYGHWDSTIELIDGAIGFVYRITNNTNSRKYIGKKLLKFATSRKPLKGRVNKRRGTRDSDWESYTGSCNQLNEDITKTGKENFTFEIICWCKSKSELSYNEIKEIILANALYDNGYYNEYVGGRIRIRKSF